jgi:hypothetical protein
MPQTTSTLASYARKRIVTAIGLILSGVLRLAKPPEIGRYRPKIIFAMMLCWISFEPA